MKPLASTLNMYNSSGGVQSIETKSYTDNGHVVSGNEVVMSRFPGGFFDSAGSPYYYLTDYQGNNIGVYDKTGKLVQRTDYYASGEPWLEPVYDSGAAGNRYLFGGKERMAGGALNEYDFEARNYVASFQRFTTIDPEAEKFPWLSLYAYCNANPINFVDPTGMRPIYSSSGKFLGTDDTGLKGDWCIMNEANFEQGMSSSDVENLSVKTVDCKDVLNKIKAHHKSLKDRPDYDGFVTYEEGIAWANNIQMPSLTPRLTIRYMWIVAYWILEI